MSKQRFLGGLLGANPLREKVVTTSTDIGPNHVLSSEDLTNSTYWTPSTGATVQSDGTTNGINMDRLVLTTSTDYESVEQTYPISVGASDVYTVSWHVKSGTYSGKMGVRFASTDVTTHFVVQEFTWSAGVPSFTASPNNSGGLTVQSNSVTDEGNGLYRMSMTLENTGGAFTSGFFRMFGTRFNSTATAGQYAIFGGCQAVLHDAPGDYAKTTTSAVNTTGTTLTTGSFTDGVPASALTHSDWSTISDTDESTTLDSGDESLFAGFNGDGTSAFTLGNGVLQIQEWPLSTAYDLTTVGTPTTHYADDTVDLGKTQRFGSCGGWNHDGTKFFVMSYGSTTAIFEIEVSTPYTFDPGGTDVISADVTPATVGVDDFNRAAVWNSDGTKLYVNTVSKKIYTLQPGVAGSVTDGFTTLNTYTHNVDTALGPIDVSPDGSYLYAHMTNGSSNKAIYRWELDSDGYPTGTSENYETTEQASHFHRGCALTEDGNKLWFFYQESGIATIKVYSLPAATGTYSTGSSVDRTIANGGILSLDEAGPEDVTATTSTPDTLDLTNTVGTETNPYEVDGIDAATDGAYFASTGITSGKHYWEVDYAVWGDGNPDFYSLGLGVYRGATAPTAGGTWLDGNPYYGCYVQNQNYTNSVVAGALGTASSSAPFPSLSGGTFGVLLDADNHTVTVYIDGTVSSDCNALSTGGSGTETYYPWFGSGGGLDWTHEVNFGQRPFNQTVPAGASAGWLLTSSETRELTPFNWGGIRGRDAVTGSTAVPVINYSLQFDGSADYLSRTVSASNRKTWTFSAWLKKTDLTARDTLFSGGTAGDASNLFYVQLEDNTSPGATSYRDNNLKIVWREGSTTTRNLTTTATFKNTTEWVHLVLALDTTQTTASDKMKLYIDGAEVTGFAVDDRSTIATNDNLPVNAAGSLALSAYAYALGSAERFKGQIAEVHFIDGQALDATYFGETSNSQWVPKEVTGVTYGTNGFHLDFEDASTAAALGNDATANGNDFTVTGLNTSDRLNDVPDPTSSDAALANTGILSLSELLQASYGLPVGPASVDIVLSLWGGGGGGGGTRNASSGDTEESGAGGNGAYLEVQISGPLATDAVLKRYVGGGGSGANASSGLDHALGGAGGAATVVVLENAAGTSFLPIAVAAAGGGGGGAGSQAAADAGPGAGGAAVDSSTGLTTTPRNSPEVSNTSGGDAAGGGTSTAGGAQPSPNGRASSSPGSSRTTANGLTIAQDGGRGATNRNAANGSGNSGGSNGSPYGGDGGSTASTAPGSHGDGDGGGGGGGWYGGSGGGCASGGGEGGSGGGAGSSYVNVGTHTFEGQDITITVRSSVVGAQNPYTGSSWVSVNNSNTGYWGSATSTTGKGGNGTSAAEAGGANGNAGAVHVGPLDGSLVSSVTSAGVAADIDIATITA